MKKIIGIGFFCGGVLISFVAPAEAAEYNRLVADKNAIKFVYKQMNVPMEGRFSRFTSRLSFDPAKPSAASARFEIDLSSIDTGATDADEEVRGKLWFNTKVYPQASFVSSSVKLLAPNRFEVKGLLTMKGKTQEVTAPVNFHQEGADGVFDGALTIRRSDFAIGEGVWSDFSTVANDVQIKFHFLANAANTKK